MRRPLLLNGFMATGKSTVGALIARRTGRPFIDLDQRVEQKLGMGIAEAFATLGEGEFRRVEREELEGLWNRSSGPAPVVALGGGALVRRAIRLDALDRSVIVTLEASPEEIVRRVGSTESRPLLAGSDPKRRVAGLLELRQRAYTEAHARVSTDGLSLEQVASQVQRIWQEDGIAVGAFENSYAVQIGSGLVGARLAEVLGAPSRLVLVSDHNVFGLHGESMLRALAAEPAPAVVVLEPGEEHKQIGAVERIWRTALAAGADRSALLLAFGGGVVSDVAGFAAASYMRGIPWVGVPTTLLSMVDASVGGKTGIDLGQAKNAAGAFHQPRAVLCDVELLRTESQRGFRSALAEVVKTALIGDRELLELLETSGDRLETRPSELLEAIVRSSIRVKARIVSQDEREGGLRAVLNLGHTVGHALESCAGYSRLTHGEAVSLGMVAALQIGVALGVTPPELSDRVRRLLSELGLPTDLSQEPLEQAVALIGHDKKRRGQRLKFIAARDVEQVEPMDLDLEQLRELARGL